MSIPTSPMDSATAASSPTLSLVLDVIGTTAIVVLAVYAVHSYHRDTYADPKRLKRGRAR